MKKEKLDAKKLLENFTTIFLFFMPLFSTTFFYNKIVTLIQIVWVFLLLILTLFVYKESRKNIKWLVLYYFVCLGYLVVSYYHQLSFKSLLPDNYDFNIISESLTILKLVTPITFIYTLYYLRIPFKKYMFILKVLVVLFAGSIVITNIFKISLGSYSDSFITKNIFEWNKYNYYKFTASKGYFMYANQISALSILFLLIFIYDYIYTSKKSIVYIILIGLSMLMIGTRVSTLGGLLTFIFALIFYFLIEFLRKGIIRRRIFVLPILIICWILILPVSPYSNRNVELHINDNNENQVISEKSDNIDNSASINNQTSFSKIDYVYNNYNKDYLPKIFFEEYYPIEYDTDFWYEFVKNNSIDKINYRYVEKSIIRRVTHINNSKLDKYVGISNTRIQKIVNIESDFILHYYAFGIIGSVILLIIYAILVIYSFAIFVKKQNYYTFVILTCVVLFLFSAILTGNIINSINIILPFIFIVSGLIYKDNKEIN